MIPKIIHHCWFNKNRYAPIPELIWKCRSSWGKWCPEYKLMFWDEDTFDFNLNTFTREAYEAGKMGFVPDFIRMWALYNYGGIYLDSDVEVLQSLDPLLNNRAFTGIENVYSEEEGRIGLGTAIIGAEPGNPWVKRILDCYTDIHFMNPDNSLNYLTSNSVHTQDAYREYADYDNYNNITMPTNTRDYGDVRIYSKGTLYPTEQGSITPNCYTIHHVAATWVVGVSVVMPVYNGSKYIRQTIESVLAQQECKFEFIIVDNASTDDTVEIIESYRVKDNRIRLIRRDINSIVDALNDGINAAIGHHIARIDCGDLMLPDRLIAQLTTMGEHKAAVCWTRQYTYHKPSTKCFSIVKREGVVDNPLESLRRDNYVSHPTTMINREFLNEHGIRYKHYNYCEDYALWIDIAKAGGKFVCLNTPYTVYTTGIGGVTNLHKAEQEAEVKRMLKDAFPDDYK